MENDADYALKVTLATYAAVADRYAHRPIVPLRREREAFVRALPGPRVLDGGCGARGYASLLAAAGLWVVGLDRSWAMLRESQRRYLLRVVQGDLRRLPFATNAFDGLFLSAALVHLRRRDLIPALLEARRLLVPDGILYLSLKGVGMDGFREGWAVMPEGGQRFFTYYRPEELYTALGKAGFLILEQWRNPARGESRPWLGYLARRH